MQGKENEKKKWEDEPILYFLFGKEDKLNFRNNCF